MKLRELTISGFRSFAVPMTLDVKALPPGLYLVAGENKVEPDLQGNGVGKSTIFEAVFWAMFGKTSRNLKAGSIRNWSSDSAKTSVELVMEEGHLLRTWSPNEL